jgi:hypothetical protein
MWNSLAANSLVRIRAAVTIATEVDHGPFRALLTVLNVPLTAL